MYAGVTNNLNRRMYEHSQKLISGFTAKYNVNKLIYCDSFNTPQEAIRAEKKIKGWTRDKKIQLIKIMNPLFRDLIAEDSSLPAGGSE